MAYTIETLKYDFLLENGIRHYDFLNELRVLSGIPRSEIPDFGDTSREQEIMVEVVEDPIKSQKNISFYEKYYNEVRVSDERQDFDLLVYKGATLGVYVDGEWLVKCPDGNCTHPLQGFSHVLYNHVKGKKDLNKMGHDARIFRRELT